MSVQAFFKKILALSALLAAFACTQLHAQTVAYVTNLANNTVSVIDTASNTVTATIPVGNTPVGVVFSPNGSRAYVTNNADGTVSVIDTGNNTVVATISLGAGTFPIFPAITPDGRSLYVPMAQGNAIVIIDTATNTIRDTIALQGFSSPDSVAITQDGLLAYVLSLGLNGVGTVTVLDTATNTQQGDPIVTNLLFASPIFPMSIAIGAPGMFGLPGHIYIPGGANSEVESIADGAATSIPLPDCSFPQGAVFTPDGARAYVTCSGTGDVAEFLANVPPPFRDPTYIHVGGGPADQIGNAAVTPDGAFVYVIDFSGSEVAVIDTASNTQTRQIGVGGFPFGIAIATLPTPPTAVAGANQTITVGQTVHLDGSGSFAPNTPPANLQYAWSFVSQPTGSTAILNNANTATPNFVADAVGDFVAQLVVTDPATSRASQPSQVTISSIWSPPTANAGAAQSVLTGALVQLNGTGSSDPNGLPLTIYDWSFTARPAGSAATITPGTLGLASFTADVAGLYTVQLVVSDAFGSSQPATVDITAITPETSQELLQDVINFISTLSASSFDAAGHSQSLTNQLQQAIIDIQKDKISQAIVKINNAIIRTDGFPVRGALDGPGPTMDWIINASDQNFAYQKLTAALNSLQ
ncbi:MAG: hypothetical protein LAO78_03410 [Acidobacteriia bacterium]|nr:hypothetical protein [Terriglobia bacterium]